MREEQTEVLVVGAGPVGLWSALLLAEAGVQVSIIDREPRITARSYACAVHGKVLELLQRLDLSGQMIERGRRIQTAAFYDQANRRVELDLSKLGGPFPFLLTLPQSELEEILEKRLNKSGVSVQWDYRLDDLADEPELVAASLEELGGTGTGYIVPHWETVVKNRRTLRAQFVIGADGQNSTVRQRLGIGFDRLTGTNSFAAYEFETEQELEDELRVVLEGTTNVLWPLSAGRCRWTFELLRSEMARPFPEKERRSARLAQPDIDERIRQYVQKVARERASWFKAEVKQIAWCTEVSFERRVVKEFGRNRCWLAGDAAHQTGPVGVQSMNSGFLEAESLTRIIRGILRQESGLGALRTYEREQRQYWQRLLGLSGRLKPRNDTDPWVRDNAGRILPCLPGSRSDLNALLAQLKLDWT